MRLFDRIVNIAAVLSALVLLFMTFILCWDVASRSFLGYGIGWALEVVEYGLLWFTLLGAAWVLRNERHVKVDILLYRFPPDWRRRLNFITSWLASGVFFVVAFASLRLVLNYIDSGEKLPTILMPPKYIPYFVIPVGCFLLAIQLIIRGWNSLRR